MIEVSNIRKSYGQHQVLKGIDLTIAAGEVVAIIGPSGSGKSTLLRCLNLLEKPDAGTIRIAGQQLDAQHYTPAQETLLRQQTAMVFQNYNLFRNKTALENITEALIVVKKIGKAAARQRGEALLAQVGMLPFASQYPVTLSGGQQQRIGIARALALEPHAILFDEPTSALDPERVHEVQEVIKAVARQNTTMVIVTHEMRFALEARDPFLG